MRPIHLALVLVSAGGCQSDVCDKVQARLVDCTPEATASWFVEIDRACRRGAGDAKAAAMFRDCASAEGCDALAGCFERHGCRLILEDPGDRTFGLMCELGSGAQSTGGMSVPGSEASTDHSKLSTRTTEL